MSSVRRFPLSLQILCKVTQKFETLRYLVVRCQPTLRLITEKTVFPEINCPLLLCMSGRLYSTFMTASVKFGRFGLVVDFTTIRPSFVRDGSQDGQDWKVQPVSLASF